MKFSGIASAALMGGLAVASFATPVVAADLATHPGAGQVLSAAMRQAPAQAQADVRGYFTANPQEYYELRGILAPIGDVQRQCNVTVLPPGFPAFKDDYR